MRAWFPATILLLALVALATVARATAVHDETFASYQSSSPAMQLVRRNEPKFTYRQMVNGELQYNPDIRPSDVRYLRQVFENRPFVHGKPLFILNDQNARVPYFEAQHALKNYGGFHAHLGGTEHVLTLTQDGTSWPGNEVIQSAKQVDKTKRIFGGPAAILTHGFGVGSVPSRRGMFGRTVTPEPPKWKDVWRSEAVDPTLRIGDLRAHLDNHRFLRFENSERTLSLGLRARADGGIEHAFWDVARGRLIDFHLH